jgi:serpin B
MGRNGILTLPEKPRGRLFPHPFAEVFMKLYQWCAWLGIVGATALPCLGETQDEKKAQLSEDLKALVQGTNEFAFDLYHELAKKDQGNIVFSPYSIATALAMTYAGARGKTAEEMAKVLHFTLPQERLHPASGDLMRKLEPAGTPPPYQFEVANALWPGTGFPLLKEFTQITSTHYRAGLTPLDYIADPEAARKTINQWVNKRTNGRITELLQLGDIRVTTTAVLTNAAYLKASWAIPFSPDHTKQADFEVKPGTKVKVPMMHSFEASFNYFKGVDYELLELPYNGERLSMIVVLPRKRGGLREVAPLLTAAKVQQDLARLDLHIGRVVLPKFKFLFRSDLSSALKALGMQLAFRDGDFSGMSRSDLELSFVIHQATISVDEQGTEASAATAVGGNRSEPPPFSFRADHPFLFLLRDGRTGPILFFGQVNTPSQ